MKNTKVRQIHQTFSIGESYDGNHSLCEICGNAVMLIIAPCCWDVDQEAFVSGERTDDRDDVPRDVELTEEISAHYCRTCARITSLSFNATEIIPTPPA